MAVEWPDFATATITDAAPLLAIADALRERQAAANAARTHLDAPTSSFVFPGGWSGAVYYARPSFAPSLDRLLAVRSYMCNIAQYFVRLEDERYGWSSWSTFPIRYSREDLLCGEHSLAMVPSPGSPEQSAASIDAYRTFLGNCAWWLKKFRYVDASVNAYCTRRSVATARRRRYTDYYDSEYSSDTGTDPRDAMGNPSNEDSALLGVLECTFHYESESSYGSRKVHIGDTLVSEPGEYPPVYEPVYEWRHHAEGSQIDEVRAVLTSGFVVRNPSALAGKLLLVPCYGPWRQVEYPTFPSRTTGIEQVDSLIQRGDHGYEWERVAGAGSETYVSEEKHGDEWREWSYRRMDYTLSAGDVFGRYVEVGRTTTWNDAGTRSAQETERSEGRIDTGSGPPGEGEEIAIKDVDGFGFGRAGVPIEKSYIAGHDQAVAVPKLDTIPFPDEWDPTHFSTISPSARPRSSSRSERTFDYAMRLCPILDFNGSYKYQETP